MATMSADTRRRFQRVAIEPSASSFLEATAQSSRGHNDKHNAQQPLSNYVALNFNFKPDSTHDCQKGALFQPAHNRNSNADWQLELQGTEGEVEAGPSSGSGEKKMPGHIFTGPQTAAKTYDLVLVWDEKEKVYRLDRIASTFSLKYERSKTVLSGAGQDAWKGSANRPRKRALDDRDVPRSISSVNTGTSAKVSGQGDLKLRSKASNAAAPVRRSSRRSIAVEMEEFGAPSEPSAADDKSATVSQSKRTSPPSEMEKRTKEDSKKIKLSDPPKDRGTSDESVTGLRRSRRRSSQTQVEETSSASDPIAPFPAEGDDDGLALELERELERELEVDMPDLGHVGETRPAGAISSNTLSNFSSGRTLSPVSRLKRAERGMKIDTPKAHTPDPDETKAFHPPPFSPRSRSIPTQPAQASIGLGLHQTGVGITPTSSPHLGSASPTKPSSGRTDEEDDDLDDFAAELDMSLAEVPSQATEQRRVPRAHTAAQYVPEERARQVRKAYGLGGPRQEEEELEDSD